MSKTPGEKLREWREGQGLGRADVASRVEISPSHLGNIETGTYVPSLPLAGALEKLTEGAVTMQDWA